MSFRITGKTAAGRLVVYAIGTAARDHAVNEMYRQDILVVSAMRLA
jgi:hypothetical protein